MKAIHEKIGANAQQMVLKKFGKPVIDAVHIIETKHDEKVSYSDQLPVEFKNYRTVKTADELRREKQKEVKDKFLEEIETYKAIRFDALIKFTNWFWLTGSVEPVRIM